MCRVAFEASLRAKPPQGLMSVNELVRAQELGCRADDWLDLFVAFRQAT